MGYLIGKIFQGITWLVFHAIGLFIGCIDICDAALTTFVVWLLMFIMYGWNGWLALALGLAVSLIVYIIFRHPIGFWVVSTLYSALWGYTLISLAKYFIFKDMSPIWFWIWVVAVAVFAFGGHNAAYYRKEIEAELAAEEAAAADK